MKNWNQIFPKNKPILGMIHVLALPGTPRSTGEWQATIDMAVAEAKIYDRLGMDGIILENMHDVPYLNRKVGPEVTAAMARLAFEVRNVTKLPLGLQILAGANKEALAVAKAADFQFIRAEGFIFGHLADEGYMDGCSGELLRYRKTIEAEHIAIISDIKKKHSSHAVTADVSIAETAHAAEFFLSDGVIVSGTSTGQEADLDEIISVKSACSIPVLIGSGLNNKNISRYYNHADGFIVGSYFKKDGNWLNSLDEKRIKDFMEIVKSLTK